MRFSLLLLLLFFLISSQIQGQTKPENKEPRILILLDGSSSMLQDWAQNQSRFKAASDIILTLIDSIYKVNNQVEFALRVYGHQRPAQDNYCYDTKLEVMFSKDNYTQMQLRLADLHPYGVTPIAYSLQQAAEQDMLSEDRYNYSLVLITDGGESCGGNICDVVKKLLDKKISFKPYILSLVDYAPLKEQYNCLGKYLLVAGEKDIKPTVGTIVDAYRNSFILQKIDKKLLQTTVAKAPSILKTDIPKFKVATEEPEKIEKPKQVEKPPVVEPVVKPAAPAHDLTDRTVEDHPKEYIGHIAVVTPRWLLPIRFATRSFKKVDLVKPIITKPEEPIVAAPPKPVIKKQAIEPPAAPAQSLKFDIKHEDAKETTLEIYFTDGHGTFYQATPQMILQDMQTGKEIKKFYRTVDASGNPDPLQLPAGHYNLASVKGNRIWKNIEIQPNSKNKITLTIGNVTLKFAYEDNPEEPVKEYTAQVKKNFEAGPVVTQPCFEEREYSPGNYHIIINTTPPSHRSLDLDFDAEYSVRILRPGWVHFTNTEAYGKINLYYELGDRFVTFKHPLVITGDPSQQKLKLERGRYRVGYNKYPGKPMLQETIKEFIVLSNSTTDVQLD